MENETSIHIRNIDMKQQGRFQCLFMYNIDAWLRIQIFFGLTWRGEEGGGGGGGGRGGEGKVEEGIW